MTKAFPGGDDPTWTETKPLSFRPSNLGWLRAHYKCCENTSQHNADDKTQCVSVEFRNEFGDIIDKIEDHKRLGGYDVK